MSAMRSPSSASGSADTGDRGAGDADAVSLVEAAVRDPAGRDADPGAGQRAQHASAIRTSGSGRAASRASSMVIRPEPSRSSGIVLSRGPSTMTLDQQLAYLTKGCVDVVRRDDLRAKLERSQQSGKPLVVKVGFDPTAPDLHLGHTVLIRKMKHFQDLGSHGDLPDRRFHRDDWRSDRPIEDAAAAHARADRGQRRDLQAAGVQAARSGEDDGRFQQPLDGADDEPRLVRLAARYNVAQMLERRDFRQRYDAGQPIALHEFLYSLVQAYDSVFLEADVEMGGTDQLFNLNVGRDIMPSFGLPPQVLLTVPLLVGLDGVEKMSKSLGNYVGVTESPSVMFGKLMSISDELMWTYYELLTDLTLEEIEALRARCRPARRIRARRRWISRSGSSRTSIRRRRRRAPRPSSTACSCRRSFRRRCAVRRCGRRRRRGDVLRRDSSSTFW